MISVMGLIGVRGGRLKSGLFQVRVVMPEMYIDVLLNFRVERRVLCDVLSLIELTSGGIIGRCARSLRSKDHVRFRFDV